MDSKPDYTAPEAAPRSMPGTETLGDGTPTDGFKQATARFGELKEYASLYVGAKLDGIKLTVRTLVLYAALGILAGIVGAGMLVTAVVLLMTGLAGAIGQLFPEPYEWWAGRLILGLLVVGGAFAAVILVMKKLTGSSRAQTIEKYESRKRVERGTFGHDVQERAREQVQRQ